MSIAWGLLPALLLKGTIIIAAAYLLNLAMRRSSASARHLVWAAALASLLFLPLLSLGVPSWSPPAAVQSELPELLSAPLAAGAGQPTPDWNWRIAVLVLWAAGTALMLGRLGHGLVRAAITVRSGERWQTLKAGAVILRSEQAQAPFVWGLFRPVIVLPWDAAGWSADRLRVVLQHELAHVRRLDTLTHLMAEVTRALYWLHPFVHLALRRMALERERACDDWVLREGADPASYAEHLLDLARVAPPSVVAMASGSQLAERLKSILDGGCRRKPPGRLVAAAVAAAIAALVIPLAAVRAGAPNSVSGLILDVSGAVVPGARITIVAMEGTARESAVSGAAGEFSAPPLSPGLYQLFVEQPGFRRYFRVIRVDGELVRQNVILQPGEISEEITVTAPRSSPTMSSGGPRRILVGGNIQASKLIYKVRPEYPAEARERNVEGSVILQAVILIDGSMGGLRVIATPDRVLGDAASAAVRQWRYQPTLLNGKPVEIVTTITVNYTLTP